jgi:hypothetical protein
MGKIITYKDGAYSQVMLSSGERIMLSFAPNELKIFKMSWGGLFPIKTIVSLGPMKLALLKEFSELSIYKFTDYLEPCVTLALTCDSIDEIKIKFSL